MADTGGIIFMDGPPKDWRRAALALANACPGLTYADAARACRYSQGFLDLVLKPEQLEAAAQALTTAGSSAAVLPLSARVAVPPAFTLLRIGIDDLGFSGLEPKSTAFARVPWRRVQLIQLAWVGPNTERARRDPEGEGFDARVVGLRTSRGEPEGTSTEPPELWCELVLAEPLARVRIRMSSFVYDCLPELGARSEDNLRAVLSLLVKHAPRALRSGLVEASLTGATLDASEPLDPAEFDRRVSWELSRLALREGKQPTIAPPAEEAPPPPSDEPVGLERTALLLARFRRRVLLLTSIPLALALSRIFMAEYPGLHGRMATLILMVTWLPVVVLLSLLYVGVQLGVDAMKERAP